MDLYQAPSKQQQRSFPQQQNQYPLGQQHRPNLPAASNLDSTGITQATTLSPFRQPGILYLGQDAQQGQSRPQSTLQPSSNTVVQYSRVPSDILVAPSHDPGSDYFPTSQTGLRVVMNCQISSQEIHRRLDDLISITKPGKHGWAMTEFEEKFQKYLRAPDDEYKVIKGILEKKAIYKQECPALDDFITRISDDFKAYSKKQSTVTATDVEPNIMTLDKSQTKVSEASQSERQVSTCQSQATMPGDVQSQQQQAVQQSIAKSNDGVPSRLVGQHKRKFYGRPGNIGKLIGNDRNILVDSGSSYSRLNELVGITEARKHGWKIDEFEEKFAKYLAAPENEYMVIKDILKSKKTPEHKTPLEEFIRILEDEMRERKRSKQNTIDLHRDDTTASSLSQSQTRIAEAGQSDVQVSVNQSQTTFPGAVGQSQLPSPSIIQSMAPPAVPTQPSPNASGILPSFPLSSGEQQYQQQQQQQQQQSKQSSVSKSSFNVMTDENDLRTEQGLVNPQPKVKPKSRKLVGMKNHFLLGPPIGPTISEKLPPSVMKYDVTMEEFQLRLNDLISITQPNKHEWHVDEFQEKFTEYLTAPEKDYEIIKKVLVNKKILGQKFPSLDDFKRMVDEDIEAAKQNTEEVVNKFPTLVTTLNQSLARVSETSQSGLHVSTYQSQSTIPGGVVQSQLPSPSIIKPMASLAVSVQSPPIKTGSPAFVTVARTTDFHHPHGGQCTLLSHPPGECCPVNIWDRYHEFKGTKKPRDLRNVSRCDVCRMEFTAFWKKESHMEEVHGVAMPTFPDKGVATSGTTDKPEELVSKRKTLKPRKVGPGDIEDYATEANESVRDSEQVISEFTEDATYSKIPLSVIETNQESTLLPTTTTTTTTVNKRPRPLAKKGAIRDLLFSNTSTAVPNTPSSQACVATPSVADVASTPSTLAVTRSNAALASGGNIGPILSQTSTTGNVVNLSPKGQPLGSVSCQQLGALAYNMSSVIIGQAVIEGTPVRTGSNPQDADSLNPQVTQLQETMNKVAAAALHRLNDPQTLEGAKLQSYTTPQQTMVTSTQQNTPIQTTIPITQTRPTRIEPAPAQPSETKFTTSIEQSPEPGSSPPESTTKNPPEKKNSTSDGDSDVECIGSVETRPSGLKLLVPQEIPERKTKTIRHMLDLRDKNKKAPSEAKNEASEAGDNLDTFSVPTTSGANAFDSRVDKLVKNKRRRGRPTEKSIWKLIPESSISCEICGKEQTNVRGQPHKCLVHSCIHCTKSCDTAQQLMDHVKVAHPQKFVYECDICKKGFNVKGTLERHMFVHSKKKEYKCSICKLAFTQSNNLKRHIAIHTGQKAFKCDECDKAFTSKYNLSQHLLVHFPKRTTYTCRFCKKTFLFARTRDKHEFTHFGFTELQCSKCLKKFPSLKSLEAHIDIYHEGIGEAEGAYYEYSDDVMSKTGSDVTLGSTLPASLETASIFSEGSEKSDGTRNYSPCKDNTLSPGNEKQEKKKGASSMTSNKKQRKHICPVCHQKFFFLLHLKEHMQSHKVPNTNEYECTICDKRFSNLEVFRAHTETHSPLHCSECDESFRFDTQLAQHKLTEHRNGNSNGKAG